MTEETPAKVLGLLAAATASMILLLAVSATGATFNQAGRSFPDPFSPQNLTAFVDQVSANYTAFMDQNLLAPAQRDFGFIPNNLAWIWNNSSPSLAVALGLDIEPLAQVELSRDSTGLATATEIPQPPALVAGAFTSNQPLDQPDMAGISIDTLYSILIR